MLAQRGSDLTREPRSPEPQKVNKEVKEPAPAESQPTRRRMTFKDKHAL